MLLLYYRTYTIIIFFNVYETAVGLQHINGTMEMITMGTFNLSVNVVKILLLNIEKAKNLALYNSVIFGFSISIKL